MDELIERERALARGADADLPETQRRRRGRWDRPPIVEESAGDVHAALLEPPSEAPVRKSRWDRPAPLIASSDSTQTQKWDRNDSLHVSHIDSEQPQKWDRAESLVVFDRNSRQPQKWDRNESLHVSGKDSEQTQKWDRNESLHIFDRDSSRTPKGNVSVRSAAQTQSDPHVSAMALARLDPELPALRPEDYVHFAVLLRPGESRSAAPEACVARLLLRIKNGASPAARRAAVRELVEGARLFGAAPILDAALPLLMAPVLEAAARHALAGALARAVVRLGADALRPHIHRVLVVAEALLMDEDGPARDEGRELVATLVRTVGPAAILDAVGADAASADEYVRGGTARIVGVVALVGGIAAVLPFLRTLCAARPHGPTADVSGGRQGPSADVSGRRQGPRDVSGRRQGPRDVSGGRQGPRDAHAPAEWAERHTGLRALQQVAHACGSAVLPVLDVLLAECIGMGPGALEEGARPHALGEDPRLRIAALSALAALAEASAPHGIASLEPVLPAVFGGLCRARGRTRAAHLRAAAALLPLMAPEQADVFARPLLEEVCARDIASPDDESRRLALRVLAIASGVLLGSNVGSLLRDTALPALCADGWTRRTVLDRRTARVLVEATVAVASRSGAAPVLAMLAVGPADPAMGGPALRDENPALHLAAVDAAAQVIARYGIAAVDDRLLAGLTDALLSVPVSGDEGREGGAREGARLLGTAWDALLAAAGPRARPLVLPLASAVLWRLANKSAAVRRSGAELAACVPRAAAACSFVEADAVAKVAAALVENLGEQSPDVLASIVSALGTIAETAVLAPNAPAHRAILDLADLLPRLTPLLRSRAEAVQEAVLAVAARVAEGAPEAAGPREWMRICFELIDMLRAQRRSVRRAAVAACGSIARAVGPQDVLSALLTNLRVQERQNRVCTTVAIAIVAERCAPFAVLPALLCEYRVPEAHVQHGVLKALAYVFEHVGPAARPYAHAVAPVLEDALTDRDQVHRQTATAALRNMALALAGHGGDDAVCHVLNAAFPSLLDPDPHVFLALHDALDAARLVLGPSVAALYVAQGLYHPARRVRDAYWRLWNALYVAAAPALAPLYPQLEGHDLCASAAPAHGGAALPCYTLHLLDVVL